MKVEKIKVSENRFAFYFEIKGNKQYNQRVVVVDKELLEWNCTCKFGSTFRFSQKNMENDVKCKHITECLNYLKQKRELKLHELV